MTTKLRSAEADREVANALRDSEERYHFLAENIPVQIWTSLPDGRLDYVTDQTARHFGLTAPQLLADGWQNVVHPDDLALAVARWIHALETGETYEVEFRLKLESGLYAWHLARAVPQRNASGAIVRWFGTNTNVEEQRAHRLRMQKLVDEVAGQAELLRQQNRVLALDAEVGVALAAAGSLGQALNACADAVVRHLDAAFARIWTVDDTRTVLELQASAGMYTHLDGAHGRVPIGQLKIGQIAAEQRPHLTNQVASDPRIGDPVWAAREGMVAFAGYPLILGTTLVGVIAAFARHPLSAASLAALASTANALSQAIERHRADEQVRQSYGEAEMARKALQVSLIEHERMLAITENARSKAETANRAKDEFLATASHELRTPLNSILGWARMLRGGSLDASGFLRGIEIIERNAKAQVQLIEDILDGSRIITGKLHLEILSVDLTALGQAALDAIRPAAAAKSITLDVTLDPAAARIKGDPDRLQQVIWNLVNNAIKFTPKGGKVEVRLERAGTSVELSVKDSGQGIRHDFLPYVFDRFRQADASTTRRHGGLGLGLALVRHLVEAHGGTVRAESDGEGLGATFVVTLPVQAVFPEVVVVARPALGDEKAPPAPAPNSLDGVRVLVIDDEPDARELVATVLRSRGAEVLLAVSAEQVLDLLETQNPAILISDIGMPVADGYAVLQRVRGLASAGARIPAIALTAYAREEDRRRALEAGFQMYLAKPVEPDALVRVVAELARTLPSR